MSEKFVIEYVDRFSGEAEKTYCTQDRLEYIQAHLRSDGKEIRSVNPIKTR